MILQLLKIIFNFNNYNKKTLNLTELMVVFSENVWK